MADLLFMPYAQRLLACLCAQMEALPEAQQPARCCFRFDGDMPTMGISTSEDECKCGTAWVRVVDWFITSDATFPGPDDSPEEHSCPRAWGLVLEMGVGRCPPTGDAGQLPTCDEYNTFFQVMMDDASAFRKAISCCFATVDVLEKFVIGQPQRVGPSGKCMQQTLNVTVMVVACNEC
jgi:hypothetical protein